MTLRKGKAATPPAYLHFSLGARTHTAHLGAELDEVAGYQAISLLDTPAHLRPGGMGGGGSGGGEEGEEVVMVMVVVLVMVV